MKRTDAPRAVMELRDVGGVWTYRTSSVLETLRRVNRAILARPAWPVLVVAIVSLIGSAGAALIDGIPQPGVHDEFSYLLAGETFASGRLANPTHSLWPYFETFHEFHEPSYASKYPPGQGFFLALGNIIAGTPILGVWLSLALCCAAICWMLQAWVPGRWAFVGGLIAAVNLGFFGYWSQSYWGGAVAALGGALVYGALRRMIRGHKPADAWLLGIGVAILLNSRPYEGLMMTLPAIAALIWVLRRQHSRLKLATIARLALPLVVMGVATAAWMAYYNYRVTGSATVLPYFVHESKYAVYKPFLFQSPRPAPVYRHAVMQTFWGRDNDRYFSQPSVRSYLAGLGQRIRGAWKFYVGYFLSLPLLLAILSYPTNGWTRFALLATAFLLLAIMPIQHFFAHYAAPATALVFFLIVQGLRRLWRWKSGPLRLGHVAVALILLMMGARVGVTAAAHLVRGQFQGRELALQVDEPFPVKRTRIVDRLQNESGQHLVLVRYSKTHNPNHEWVFNAAEIDSSKIVWARDIPGKDLSDLLGHYRGRKLWVLYADEPLPVLSPLFHDRVPARMGLAATRRERDQGRSRQPSITALATGFALAGGDSPAEHYVSSDANPSGNGSFENPWNLRIALAHPEALRPGDTLWLRGGVYPGPFVSELNGEAHAPIIVRQYPGERAVIDGASRPEATLTIKGSWTWYWGFEVTNTSPNRVSKSNGSWVADEIGRGTGVDIYGANVKCINLVVHDTALAMGFWSGSDDSELYGNLVFNNGWDAPDRGHGHGIYAQNQTTTKRLIDNIVLNQFSHGIHIYGSSEAFLNGFDLRGNILANNGSLSTITSLSRNLLLGGGRLAEGALLMNNFMYSFPWSPGNENNVGYTAGCRSLTARDNYFAGWNALTLSNCEDVVMTGNVFAGAFTGFKAADFPGNTYTEGRPKGVAVYVRPNQYESGRAHIAVYNWARQHKVQVDLSSVLRDGDPFEIRDAANFHAAPVAIGTYRNGLVDVPMALKRTATPIGNAPVPPPPTGPEFGAFVVVRTNPETERPPAIVAGADQTILLPGHAELNAVVSADDWKSDTVVNEWQKVSGPGEVAFGDEHAASTTARFSKAGMYNLRLTAKSGDLESSDELTIYAEDDLQAQDGPAFSPIRVNAGGPAFLDSLGQQWMGDTAFSTGPAYFTVGNVSGTGIPVIYKSLHYNGSQFDFQVAVPNGKRTVKLRFAEIYRPDIPEERIFHVRINGQQVLTNFNVLAAAGGAFKAHDLSFPIEVSTGRIIIEFVPVKSGAIVSGIEIF